MWWCTLYRRRSIYFFLTPPDQARARTAPLLRGYLLFSFRHSSSVATATTRSSRALGQRGATDGAAYSLNLATLVDQVLASFLAQQCARASGSARGCRKVAAPLAATHAASQRAFAKKRVVWSRSSCGVLPRFADPCCRACTHVYTHTDALWDRAWLVYLQAASCAGPAGESALPHAAPLLWYARPSCKSAGSDGGFATVYAPRYRSVGAL